MGLRQNLQKPALNLMNHPRKRLFFTRLAPLMLLLLAACAPQVKLEQPVTAANVTLANGHNLGQTFTAYYAGLQGIALFLSPGTAQNGQITLHLRSSPEAQQDLASASLPVQAINAPGYYRFNFNPQAGSAFKDYYLQIDLETSDGYIEAGSGPGDSYQDGAMYQDGKPLDSQAAFRLAFDSQAMLLELLGEGFNWLVLLLAALFLFLVPGWALLELLWPAWKGYRWTEKAALAAGTSLGLYPLLILWTSTLGLRPGAVYAWLPPIAGALFLAGTRLLKRRNNHHKPEDEDEHRSRNPILGRKLASPSFLLADLALLGIMALVAGTRFWAVRRLPAPMWGDAYQHTMITQLLVDHGGLFNSWAPYAPMQSFTYHFGFHAATAVFHWITGLSVPLATLWNGQILNLLAVLAVLPLATRLGKSPWAGVVAVLVAGLISPMPMAYANWGRFPQLAGQVILPGVMLVGWEVLAQDRLDWKGIFLGGMLLSGLALTHYRIVIFAVLFLGVLLLFALRQKQLKHLAIWFVGIGLVSFLLFLPWFFNMFGGRLLQLFAQNVATPAGQISAFQKEYNAIGNLFDFLPAWVWLSMPVIAGWGLWRRERGIAAISLWWLGVFLIANPQWLHLPGAGNIGTFTVEIASYIPAAILLGAGLGWLLSGLGAAREEGVHSMPALSAAFLALILLAGGVWWGRQRLTTVDVRQFTLLTRPDLRAFDWIRLNTPENSGFLVNSFFAFNNSLNVGSDGGWWLALFTKRNSSTPPINYGTESGLQPDFRQWINALPSAVQAGGIDSQTVKNMLSARGINYVYIGQKQGSVNSPGPLLNASALMKDPDFRLVYRQDRVWIYAYQP
jgi:hypothetical protein